MLSGCQAPTSGGAPTTYPERTLLAWIGDNGSVNTRELPYVQTDITHFASALITSGPALAYDGELTWMVMWNRGGQLEMRVGVGGDPNGPILWDSASPDTSLRVGAVGSPALASGRDRFVAVFKTSAGSLAVVRTTPLQAAQWSDASVLAPLTTPSGAPIRPSGEPALAFGTLGGTAQFVLVFLGEAPGVSGIGPHAFAALSPDGLAWRVVADLGEVANKSPAIAMKNGVAYVILAVSAGLGFQSRITRSNDGRLWGDIALYGPTANTSAGPALAWQDCTLITTEAIGSAAGGSFFGISERTATDRPPCVAANALSLSSDQPIEIVGTSRVEIAHVPNLAARTALVHGGGSTAIVPVTRHLVLLTGGINHIGGDEETEQAGANIFDAESGSIGPLMPLQQGRFEHTATLLDDGSVLLAGGLIASEYADYRYQDTGTAELFANGAFTAVGSMATARFLHTATLLGDGTVLVTGGAGPYPPSGYPDALDSAEVYRPAARLWTPLQAHMLSSRADHQATRLLDGSVLITGGVQTPDPGTPNAELYDPIAQRFTRLQHDMTSPRWYHTATLLADGTVLVAGGISSPRCCLYPWWNVNSPPLASAEIFDPSTQTFSRTGDMNTARQGHTATRLRDGNVLITGGFPRATETPTFKVDPLASAELYVVASHTFRSVGPMLMGRVEHGATLLGDGRVLIAGGKWLSANRPVPTEEDIEIYDPSTESFTRVDIERRFEYRATLLAR